MFSYLAEAGCISRGSTCHCQALRAAEHLPGSVPRAASSRAELFCSATKCTTALAVCLGPVCTKHPLLKQAGPGRVLMISTFVWMLCICSHSSSWILPAREEFLGPTASCLAQFWQQTGAGVSNGCDGVCSREWGSPPVWGKPGKARSWAQGTRWCSMRSCGCNRRVLGL